MFERAPGQSARSNPGRRRPRSRLAVLCGALGLASACLNPAISDEAPISQALSADPFDDETYDAGVQAVDELPEPLPTPPTTPPERRRGDTRARGTRRR